MDKDQEAVVQRWLSENDLDAEHVLNVLVQTLVKRHVDCEMVKLGRRIQAQPRPDSLVTAMDALHEYRHRNAKTDPALADLQNKLFAMMTECQFAAEATAGLNEDDDDDSPGPMRLVTD